MKIYLLALIPLFFVGCLSTNANTASNVTYDYSTPNPEVPENEHIAVCGKVDNTKQTYPTLKDLKADGATFLYYGPCDD